jgi:hypothetical protein
VRVVSPPPLNQSTTTSILCLFPNLFRERGTTQLRNRDPNLRHRPDPIRISGRRRRPWLAATSSCSSLSSRSPSPSPRYEAQSSRNEPLLCRRMAVPPYDAYILAGAGRIRRFHRWRVAPLPPGSAGRPGSVTRSFALSV